MVHWRGIRFNDWKMVFLEQRAHGLRVWEEPLVALRLPKLFNLRRDPFERADHEAQGYDRWRIEHVFALYGAQALAARFVSTFEKFPPRQRPASFAVDQIMETFSQRHGQ